MFNTLHLMFMTQYTEQWAALDLIAERIRALGYPAPGTYSQSQAGLHQGNGRRAESDGNGAPSGLRPGSDGPHRAPAVPAGGQTNNQPTADLITQRLELHEKTAWMLRSLLEE